MRALEDRTFLAFLIIATIAMIWITLPFFSSVLWALVAAIVFRPVHRRINARLPSKPNLAAFVSLLLLIAIVIVPAFFIGSLLVDQALDTYARLQKQEIDFGLMVQQVWAAVPDVVREQLDRMGLGNIKAIQDRLSTFVSTVLRFVAGQAVSVGQSAFGFMISLGIMLYLTFFLFRDGGALVRKFGERMPIHRKQRRDLLEKFTTVIRATIKGSVVVAFVQGFIGGCVFWFLGIEGALLWGVVMGFLSLLPAIGTGLIWVPVAIYLFASGAVWQGVVLVICGVFIIGMVDNVLRPILVGKDTRMPDYVVLLSTLGGISVLGMNGFVIGPVIAAMFIAAWDIFAIERQGFEDQDVADPPLQS